jgi:ligand-binding sensor domain-containing protein
VLKIHLRFFLFLILALSAGGLKAQSTFIEHYDIKSGLPSNTCFFSLQDSQGYIWVATDAGVSRFDGKYFRNYSIDDGLPDNQILQIKEDRSGKIWFLSFSGKLSYYFKGKVYNEANSSLLHLLKFNEIIVSFFEDQRGHIWFGSNKNQLYRYDGEHLIKYVSKDPHKQFFNAVVHQDAKGKIWVVSQHITMTFVNDTFYAQPSVTQPISYKTLSTAPGKDLLYLDTEGLKLLKKPAKPLNFHIPLSMLNPKLGFVYASETELWLSNTEGVFEFRIGMPVKQYLLNIPTNQVFKDRTGNMWFTTSNGIYMLPKFENRMYVVGQDFGLSSNYIKSITNDKEKRLWLGMDDGVINVLSNDRKTIRVIKLSKPGFGSNIKQLLIDTGHSTLYYSTDQALGRIKNIYSAALTTELLKDSANSVLAIKNFSISNKNELALATASGVFLLNASAKQFKFHALKAKKGKDFYVNRAFAAFFDKKSNLWYSNTEGLMTVANGKPFFVADKNFFKEKRINDIKELGNGMIALAMDGFGIALVKDGKIKKRITVLDGLADNICKKLFLDGEHLWVITNNGINNICLDGHHPEIQAYEYTNALLKNDVNDLYIGKDTAYFATNNGLVYFLKKGFEKKSGSSKVLVSAIINNGNLLDVADTLASLNPSRNNITFVYSSIDFQSRDLIYRFRLKPEDNWTETRNRRLEFSSLSPGDYTFEISSKSNNADWSEPTKIYFKLEEHFWQHNWFILVLLIAASFTFYKIAVVITKWQKNQEQKQLVLKHKILILEQRALQAMMNPHFIFNVMNSIQHYINTKNTSSANRILTGFARLIRKNLEICTKSFISLEEELEYLSLYLGLEKTRFGDKFNYQIKINPSIDKDEIFIPSMLLQPYIENAIWHGLMPKEEGGNIEISMEIVDQELLLIYITDDGIGIENSLRTKRGSHSSKGMSLTQERVTLLNQIESIFIKIDISQRGVSGTMVTIKVPI